MFEGKVSPKPSPVTAVNILDFDIEHWHINNTNFLLQLSGISNGWYIEDISEGGGGNAGFEKRALVILIFPLPSPIENHCPIKWINSVVRKLLAHFLIHSLSIGLGTVKDTADKMVSKMHSLTLRNVQPSRGSEQVSRQYDKYPSNLKSYYGRTQKRLPTVSKGQTLPGGKYVYLRGGKWSNNEGVVMLPAHVA